MTLSYLPMKLDSSNCRPGVLGVTELSRHLTPTPWGAILQICFIWDLYKLTRSLPDNNPCCWMWLMLAETRRMCVRVTGKGGRGRKLIFITPEKLLMMRDTRFLTRDGHQVTIMSHGSHTCHHVTISWGNIFLVCLCQIRSFSKWVFLCSRKASLYFSSNLLHVLIRSPKFFKRILFLMAGIKWHMRLLQTPTRCSQPGLVNSQLQMWSQDLLVSSEKWAHVRGISLVRG